MKKIVGNETKIGEKRQTQESIIFGIISAIYYIVTFILMNVGINNIFWGSYFAIPSIPSFVIFGNIMSLLFSKSCICNPINSEISQIILAIINSIIWFVFGFALMKINRKKIVAIILWLIITVGISSILSLFLIFIGNIE
jgi:hypothetical protein